MGTDGTVAGHGWAAHGRGLAFPILIVASVLVIIVPMPPLLMDLLLACNITLSVVILLTTIYVDRPLDFSVFPTILLGTTLARLVLNIASTRLILSRGALDKTGAAGGVIEAFGKFVAEGQLVIGTVIFLIIVIIQFVVITKGAGRIGEVAARFFLDGIPGRQIAIDADLAAGHITPEQARAKRAELTQQSDMYAAMDGATKFVRGDAVAGIIITFVNILAGLYFGMVEGKMPLRQALEVYGTLTIGDGLVSQVPGFLISLAAGLLITRSSNAADLPRDMIGQVFRHPEAMMLSSAFLAALAFTGLPMVPMLALGGGCLSIGLSLRKTRDRDRALAERKRMADEQTAILASQAPEKAPEPIDHLALSALEVELGAAIVSLALETTPSNLGETLIRTRRQLAEEIGMVMPNVRLRSFDDSEQIYAYTIKIRDIPVAYGEARPDGYLAVDSGMVTEKVRGLPGVDPLTGAPAIWIEEQYVDRAKLAGYQVHEPITVITTHVAAVFKEHAAELLSRQHVHELLQNLKKNHEQLVTELVPGQVRVSLLHQVLCKLLKEGVSIRPLDTILETIGDHVDRVREPTLLTEKVRAALARHISRQHRDASKLMRVVTIDPALEDVLGGGIKSTDAGMIIDLSPQIIEKFNDALAREVQKLVAVGFEPIVVTGHTIRAGVRQITYDALPKLVVLGAHEISRDTEVEAVGQVELHAVYSKRPTAA